MNFSAFESSCFPRRACVQEFDFCYDKECQILFLSLIDAVKNISLSK